MKNKLTLPFLNIFHCLISILLLSLIIFLHPVFLIFSLSPFFLLYSYFRFCVLFFCLFHSLYVNDPKNSSISCSVYPSIGCISMVFRNHFFVSNSTSSCYLSSQVFRLCSKCSNFPVTNIYFSTSRRRYFV